MMSHSLQSFALLGAMLHVAAARGRGGLPEGRCHVRAASEQDVVLNCEVVVVSDASRQLASQTPAEMCAMTSVRPKLRLRDDGSDAKALVPPPPWSGGPGGRLASSLACDALWPFWRPWEAACFCLRLSAGFLVFARRRGVLVCVRSSLSLLSLSPSESPAARPIVRLPSCFAWSAGARIGLPLCPYRRCAPPPVGRRTHAVMPAPALRHHFPAMFFAHGGAARGGRVADCASGASPSPGDICRGVDGGAQTATPVVRLSKMKSVAGNFLRGCHKAGFALSHRRKAPTLILRGLVPGQGNFAHLSNFCPTPVDLGGAGQLWLDFDQF